MAKYITTPIFYPSGTPHIGTAYTMFIADTLARYSRLKGEETLFLAGNDEHGGNIAKKAYEQGVSPQAYVDQFADIYQQVWRDLSITNDYFIRTTQEEHQEFAATLLQRSHENGDIYPGEYSGWYCESCEAYYAESDLVAGKCPHHPTKEPVFAKEKNYYFRWSKYRDWLLQFYEQTPDFIQPQKWFDYAKDFVQRGLTDIPVTRANVKWGIPVPFDPEQTIYVWYDALPNYLSYLHLRERKASGQVGKFWPEVTHVLGKDIIKFHAILWPAMLKSAEIEPPRRLLVHGFFTVNGQKIGKSNNNAIDPLELTKKYGLDAVRYALLSEFQIGNDGDFNLDRLEAKYNSDLANNWGNLLNRVIHLAESLKLDVEDESLLEQGFKAEIDTKVQLYHRLFTEYKLFEAIQLISELTDYGNKYIAEHRPWEKAQSEIERRTVLSNLVYLLKTVNDLYSPVLPSSSTKAAEALSNLKPVILFPKFEEKEGEPKP